MMLIDMRKLQEDDNNLTERHWLLSRLENIRAFIVFAVLPRQYRRH